MSLRGKAEIIAPKIRVAFDETLQVGSDTTRRYPRERFLRTHSRKASMIAASAFRGDFPLLRLPHQRIEAIVCLVLVLPEGMTLPPDGDIPRVAGFPEPRSSVFVP